MAGAALPLPALALGDEERFTIATLDLGAGSPGHIAPRGSADSAGSSLEVKRQERNMKYLEALRATLFD